MNGSKHYPSQTGAYTVKVKNGSGWNAFSIARLQISVGQDYHEKEKFEATVSWAKHRFSKVLICVNDTLQRHNFIYSEGLSENQALAKCTVAGDEWIKRNFYAIRSITNYEIIRWDKWRGSPAFKSEYDYVLALYDKDTYVRDYVQQQILIFWKRRLEQNPPDSFVAFKAASVNYLLEEIAVFFLMFKQDMAADIYPGSTLLPCMLAQKYCRGVKTFPLGERAFTRIDFSRRASSAA